MQSHYGSASTLPDTVAQSHADRGAADAGVSVTNKLSRALRRVLQRVRTGHAEASPAANRFHMPLSHHDRQAASTSSRAQHQQRAGAARDALRIQQAMPQGHGLRALVPPTDASRWLAVCEAVAGWQQEMARRLHRYSGPLLTDTARPTEQGLALAATRMLLAMQQKNRHLVLDGIPVMRLPAALCLAEELERLTVHDCDLFEWPASGGLPVNLSALHFARNPRLSALPGRIGKLLQLQEIVVLDSPLRALPSSLSQLPKLERLVLQGTDLRIVPVELGTLAALQTLTLASNKLLSQLPISLGQLAQLRELHLRGNPLLSVLPDTLGNLAELERLDLRENTAMTTLPGSLGRLRKLRHLDVSGMSNLVAVPEGIGHCVQLRTLRLRDCGSLRSLPASVGDLKQLTHLDLRGCYALAGLPDTLRDLPPACRVDVPAHLSARLAELRPIAGAIATAGSAIAPDWIALRQGWRARLQPYDAEYGSDALCIWMERYINAIAPDALRAYRDSRRLGLLVDGLCELAALRSAVFQRAQERYALGCLDEEALSLDALMAMLLSERLREPGLPEDAAARMVRGEAFAALLEYGAAGGSVDEAVQKFAAWPPLQSYVARYVRAGDGLAQRHVAVARDWLHAG
ncbi:leucine-rich repeat domain-containing protein [Ralstonia sp. CHL-2022]|uniref:Leucine-rich repeat domain-containing protein n=1 Tax=Ralstonia mojiangensis TaxID=2953895 RepID=A0ABT2L9I7_9RALS|nr:leucine-rich repeat domain-containing protein [Ralstonia mojiangensis]KJJ95459.1 leucine-rich-repeat type III effector protein (popC-like) [Burkholderiaceae bacterium 26]MCT7311990.1 leucine-rich repeat domain-containing protein [Ralstonia mojiangensis]MCT7327558.1 leucine-rich repeat domain-containing protein [Ralstonia mojiangensis]